jgi:phosphohistidine phosphatase
MDLILWRHAEAGPGEPDEGRVLTAKGRKQAARVALWLDRHLPDNTRILVSPAERCQQTAAALGRKHRTVEELAPAARAAAVLAACGWPDGKESVLVIGHQPTLGQVASFLLAGEEQDWTLKKAAVWWISRRTRGLAARTVLKAVVAPDFL